MQRILLLSFLGSYCFGILSAQTPILSFEKSYGGTKHEYAWKTIPTSDGGMAFVGFSKSDDGDLSGHHGSSSNTDLWVCKTNAAGGVIWSKLFGGSENDQGYDILQTTDGGYMVVGYTRSDDGDVTNLHNYSGTSDLWVLKLNVSGGLVWEKCYGGTDDDQASAIVAIPGGGYYIGGTTYSNDVDVSNHHSYADMWVIKIDESGTLLSQKCIGGTDFDEGIGLILTNDNGCLIYGRTSSNDGDAIGYHAGSDMLLAKLSASLSLEWSKCYGGSGTEECNSAVQLADGSYAALGYTSTHNNGDITGHHGNQGSDDFWLLKLTSTGSIDWAKCYGGSGDDQANGLTKTSEGGFVMTGLTNSLDGDVSGFHIGGFDPDIWTIGVSENGSVLWQRCSGGSGQDESFNIYEESTNIYVITGFTYSTDYDVSSNHGSADGWIIKIKSTLGVEETDPTPIILQTYPNPTQDYLTIDLGDVFTVIQISIRTVLGQEIATKRFTNNSKIELNLNGEAGIYFIDIKADNHRATTKIIKH
ncbi:MAG: T9SS type A sorting domain-containing protein [Flavobacteriales bacterium]|nr:T9SS type A sorting domain-containing protein [Flavobacteriales bacterium]